MDAALAHPDLPEALHRLLLLHRAHALRVAGRYAAGAGDYQRLWDAPGEFRADAGYWLADYAFLQGNFRDALDRLGQLTDIPADLHGEILRLQGHVHRVNALFGQAEHFYQQALEAARQAGNVAVEGTALTDLLQTLCWSRPAEARDVQPRALEVNDALRSHVELVKIHAATAVMLASLGDPDGADDQISDGLHLAEQSGYRGGLVWCQVAAALTQLHRGDPDAARDTATRLADIVSDLHGNRFWSEIVTWWTHDVPAASSTTSWLDGEDAARARWLALRPSPGLGDTQESHG
jgi:tetratricopeptide (TPR) repeat protein